MPVTPEVQSILDLIEAVGETPREQLNPTELRQGYAALSMVESKAEMASVTDRTIPGPAGDIPVRVYVPTTRARAAPGPRLLPRRRLGDRRPRHPRRHRAGRWPRAAA